MDTKKRIVLYVLVLVSSVVFFTLLYRWGMGYFENESRSYIRAFGVVIETFTTTGYGSDAPWSPGAMNLIVVAMQLTGVTLLFTTLPLFVMLAISTVLSDRVPRSVDMTDHVVICNYTSRGETIIEEFEERCGLRRGGRRQGRG